MRPVSAAVVLVFAIVAGPATARTPQGGGSTAVWNFDADRAGAPPAGFTLAKTDGGTEPRWVIRAETDAASHPNVLAQLDADRTSGRFPVAVAHAPTLRDLRLSVRCKPVSGRVDQACGLVFRYRDANNYYVTRANALEDNVRLYYVRDGRRREIASWNGKVGANVWHELRAEARGDRFEVYWDGEKVLDAQDRTFPDAGRVGVWTKADSVTYFDDLKVEPLGS
ncbi:MAG TPA: hypothetical protein VF406_01410 [Thermodesulfobacteriota bacterium]